MPITHPLVGLQPIRRYKRVQIQPLADLLGVTYNSYCRYESGKRRIFLDQAVMLARALGVSVDDLGVWRDDDELLKLLGPSSAQLAPTAPQVPPPPADSADIVVSAQAGDTNAAVAGLQGWDL